MKLRSHNATGARACSCGARFSKPRELRRHLATMRKRARKEQEKFA